MIWGVVQMNVPHSLAMQDLGIDKFAFVLKSLQLNFHS